MSSLVQRIEAIFDANPVEWDGIDDLRRAIIEAIEDASSRAKCIHCGAEAVCVGRYEGPGEPEPACGECCGHGNEDGWCVHLDDHDAVLALVQRMAKRLDETDRVVGKGSCAVEWCEHDAVAGHPFCEGHATAEQIAATQGGA